MLIGYATIREMFEKARKSGALAHAYCLVGPRGVGKETVARSIASALLGIDLDKLELSPNFHCVVRKEDEKTGKLKKEIGVKDARELKNILSKGRWGSDFQVVIIDEAELLNEEASNALLKLLEEPPEGSVFFLLTTNDQALLPTIRSRVEVLVMPPLSDDELGCALVQKGYAQKVIERVLPFAAGRMGVALTLLNNFEALEKYEKEITRLSVIIGQPFYAKLKQVEDLFGDSEDHIRGRDTLQDVLELWLMWFKRELEKIVVNTRDQSEYGFTAERITFVIDEILFTRSMLSKNVHPRLLIEQLLLHL